MHISTTEAALLGAAIAAIGGPISAFAVQRATRKREQAARVWEGSRDVYHFVLAIAHDWKSKRSTALRMYSQNKTDSTTTDPQIEDNKDETRRLWVDLRLYAADEVQKAFSRYTDADKSWFIAHFMWYQVRNPGFHGPIKFGNNALGDEESLRKAAEQAAHDADAEQEKLEKTVWNAVHHPKRYKRKF